MPSDASTCNALLTGLVVVGRLACTAVFTGLDTPAVALVPVAVGTAGWAAIWSLAGEPASDLAVALPLSALVTAEPGGCTMSNLSPADLSAAMLSLPPEVETAEPDVATSASVEAAVAVRVGKDLTSFWAARLEVAAAAAEEAGLAAALFSAVCPFEFA